ncbi:hypothetical protein CFP65_7011 [Kitasatospora sp. MMS16-BH015]|uniref:threonine/serine exporter family protein n=1 Tax=Kitasatospora sp. MMS16-BH015 TaxID=2018025 RepID=UPI000CA147F5|nr:threonine/serine exporter family protein [Kitasatospora sp. MMS16-BH015]AUG81620.1 hypothetical protein CFP65_7011 [Kitasatospora sp. MMS16-BH015]
MPSRPLPWLQQNLGRLRGLEDDPDPMLSPPDDPTAPDAAFVIALALLIGESLFANGASAEETCAGMLVTAEAYGLLWCEPSATLWVLSLSGRMPTDTKPTVEQRVMRRHFTDFTALGETEQLIQEISEGAMPAAEARRRALALRPTPAALPRFDSRRVAWRGRMTSWGTAAAHGGAVAAGGSLVAGGGLRVVLPSFLAATVANRVFSLLEGYGVLTFYRSVAAALPAALAAIVMNEFGHGRDSPAIVVGGILALLPALTVIGAVQDSLTGHYLTAYARLLDAVLIFLALVAGIGAAFTVAAQLGRHLPLLPPASPPSYLSWRLAGTVLLAWAVAYRMKVPPRAWGTAVLLSLGGLIAYIALREAGCSRLLATGIVATAIGAMGQLAVSARASTLPWVIPAVTPFLPGSALYRALSELAVGETSRGVGDIIQTIGIWGTLAAGVSLSGEAAAFVHQLRAQRQARRSDGR